MGLDLLIPFGILIFIVVYLIYSRNSFEKKMLSLYEEKYENWKDNYSPNEKKTEEIKEYIGIVYKEKGRTNIEVFDEKHIPIIKAGKYNIHIKH